MGKCTRGCDRNHFSPGDWRGSRRLRSRLMLWSCRVLTLSRHRFGPGASTVAPSRTSRCACRSAALPEGLFCRCAAGCSWKKCWSMIFFTSSILKRTRVNTCLAKTPNRRRVPITGSQACGSRTRVPPKAALSSRRVPVFQWPVVESAAARKAALVALAPGKQSLLAAEVAMRRPQHAHQLCEPRRQ